MLFYVLRTSGIRSFVGKFPNISIHGIPILTEDKKNAKSTLDRFIFYFFFIVKTSTANAERKLLYERCYNLYTYQVRVKKK